MNGFHLICLCSVIIANVFGLPFNTLNNVQHQRLRNYPVSQLYSTQIIDYPGMYIGGEIPLNQMIGVPVPNSHFHQRLPVSGLELPIQQPISTPQPIASTATATTTTTTEAAPIVVKDPEPEFDQDVKTFEQDFGALIPTTTVQSQRLRNYPVSQLYSTQIIDYPGMYIGGEIPLNQMIAVPVPVSHFHQQLPVSGLELPIQQPISTPQPIASTTTTTEAAPIVVKESEPEFEQDVKTFEQDFGALIQTTTVRTQVPSHYRYGVRRDPNFAIKKQVATNQRFGGQDIDQPSTIRKVPITRETEEERLAREEQERLIREEQAKNAHYTFGTMIDDKINDHSIQRQETRNGLALKGMYSYSDGFFRRVVHYEADENGYRVVKEDVEPIGDGPQFDPNGRADIQTNSHNNELRYSITAEDFVREKHNGSISITTTERP